jgi:photosystem II stability/assembly factor-like uncharacterized protein
MKKPGGLRLFATAPSALQRPVWAAFCLFLAAGAPANAVPSAPQNTIILSVANAANTVAANTVAGNTVLAVGDRGTILRSADGGAHFAPVASPTHATLTRVVMSGTKAYATGFDATILRSDDAGAHWLRVLSDERGDNPLFGVVTSSTGAALAVGGFGRAYTTTDGSTWQRTHILNEDDDFHLNDALNVAPDTWLVVGEQALVMLSTDAGGHWQKLPVPVQGSLFGAVVLSPQRWLIFGLRGHIVATSDAGAHFHAIESGVTAELLGGTVLRDGRALLVGNRGTAVLVAADLLTAHALKLESRDNYADCLQRDDGTVLAVGESGITTLQIPAVPGQ